MANAMTIIFILFFCVSIVIVMNGYTLSGPNVIDKLFSTSDLGTSPVNLSSEVTGAVSPGGWQTSSAGTGDTGFNFVDVLRVGSGFIDIVLSLIAGPITLAFAIPGMPATIIWLLLAPMSVVYWISLAMFIRGMMP